MTFGMTASPAPPDSAPGSTVAMGPFWPEIALADVRDIMRVGGTTIPDPRLIEALRAAIVSVDEELADWKAAQLDAGYETLLDVPSATMAADGSGVPTLTRLSWTWRRAVLAMATADLTETHRDLTATREGAARAEEIMPTADDHRRNATHAIRDILGVPRTAVELI